MHCTARSSSGWTSRVLVDQTVRYVCRWQRVDFLEFAVPRRPVLSLLTLISVGQHGSLRLSAALLGAILVNGFAYNESKKQLKGVEVELKEKLDAMEGAKRRLEVEVHR